MGKGIVVTCKSCNKKSQEFILGVGMEYNSIDNDRIIQAVDLREKEKVINILNNYKITGRECINALFICPKCNRLYGNFHVRIIYKDIIKGKEFEIYADDEKQFQTEFFCNKCYCSLKILGEDDAEEVADDDETYEGCVKRELKNYPCSKCGKKTLESEDTMLWD